MFFNKKPPKNYEDRTSGVSPSLIIMHYTGMESAAAALERLNDPSAKVSAHYFVDEDGSVKNLVPEDKRAWHAGVSFWNGESDINSHSIGIEMVNPGHELGYRAFPQVQVDAVLTLCRAIMTRYRIKNVLAHSDVAPERKQDPGELFPWEWLAHEGIGLWPNPGPEEWREAEQLAENDFEAEKLLTKYGYNPVAAYIDVVTAFHRHYFPKKFEKGTEAEIETESLARLIWLIKHIK